MNELRSRPVLILGAGINGAALARELVLNGVPVLVVDVADIASGTTSYSSRLIHGGLRYLEYGDFGLVRESVRERTTLLACAPHLVRPLRLYIPLASRSGGFLRSGWRLAAPERWQPRSQGGRGLWLVRAGLWLYDWCARSSTLPRHSVHSVAEPAVPDVDPRRFRWLCSYYDAQVEYPELLTVALLQDAREVAEDRGVRFEVLTYRRATLRSGLVQVHHLDSEAQPEGVREDRGSVDTFRPSAIVNATGAWVDRTLQSLHVASSRLIGGTRGSHLVTSHRRLREALRGGGVYVEGADGRPVFFLPLGKATLIGTTDVPFEGDPHVAVATEAEIEYLLGAVRRVFPQMDLCRQDIDLTYAGVRPLPAVSAQSPSAISRRHYVHAHVHGSVPMYSLVGGKLTTCRAVAEEIAQRILREIGQPIRANSRTRALPGGEGYPVDEAALDERHRQLARRWGATQQQVRAVWNLCGTRTDRIFAELASDPDASHATLEENVPDTDLPCVFVRWIIRNQWVRTVGDLVERRLMLVFHPHLSNRSLYTLAALLVAEGRLARGMVDEHVENCCQRLRSHFGRSV